MSDVEKYLAILNHSYIQHQESLHPMSRLEYLSSGIFDFITYDSEIDEIFGQKALEVCLAINKKQTFEYIRRQENYRWYLLLMNTPFFLEKTEWGTSIRGAWWNHKISLNSLAIYEGYQQLFDMILTNDQWHFFVEAMALFCGQQGDSK